MKATPPAGARISVGHCPARALPFQVNGHGACGRPCATPSDRIPPVTVARPVLVTPLRAAAPP